MRTGRLRALGRDGRLFLCHSEAPFRMRGPFPRSGSMVGAG